MSSVEAFQAVFLDATTGPVCERLLKASVELSVLAIIVWAVIKLLRIRSARVCTLLWLLVLVKAVVGPICGGPVRVVDIPVVTVAPSEGLASATRPDDQEPSGVSPARAPEIAIENQSTLLEVDPEEIRSLSAATESSPEPAQAEGAVAGAVADETSGTSDSRAQAAIPFIPRTDSPPPNPAGDPSRPVPAADASTPAVQPIASAPGAAEESWIGSMSAADRAIGVWLGGVTLLLGLTVLGLVRIWRWRRGATGAPADILSLLREEAKRLGVSKPPDVRVSNRIDSPMLVGLVRRTILVPRWLAEDPLRERLRWILAHELMHGKMHDPIGLAVRRLAQMLMWFHPVVWWAGRRWEEAMELACDRALVEAQSQAREYAHHLYGLLEGLVERRKKAPTGIVLFATRTQVGRRIAALLARPLGGPARLGALAVAGLLGVAALGFLCSIGIRPSSSAGEGHGAGEEIAKIAVPARAAQGREWIDTGIPVSNDEALTLRTTGYASCHAAAGFFSADGATTPVTKRWGPREGLLDPNAPPAALVGKIGGGGDSFFIGTQRTVRPPSSGTLFLAFNDAVGKAGDNFGTFTVAVFRGEDAVSSETVEAEQPPESPPLSIRPELIGTERWIPKGFEYLYPELEKGPFVLKGHVTAPDGSPAGGVRIVAFRGEAWEWGARETKSAGDGSYEIRNLPDGPYFLTAIAADGFGLRRFAFHRRFRTGIDVMTGNELELDIELQPYGPEVTTGRVVTMEGEPVPDALVLSTIGWGYYGISLAVQARTDGQGRYVMPHVLGQVHPPLIAVAEGRGPGLLRDVRSGEADHVIVLGDGVRLAGTVRFKDSGKPAAGIPVTLRQTPADDDLPNITTKTDATGTFVFERLLPFRYQMTLDAAERELAANEHPMIRLLDGQDRVGLEFTLSRGATVAGRVMTSDTSEPLAGVKVWIPAFRGPRPFREAVTGPDGKYELAHLPSGEFTVECETPTTGVMRKVRNDVGGGRNFQQVKLAADEHKAGVDFRFVRGAVLSGRVTDKEGRPVAGARVSGNNWERRRRPGEMLQLPWVTTAADGTYRLAGLGKGHTWAITVSADGYARAVSDAIQTGVDISGKDFVLEKASRLSGRVVDEDGRPVPFCLVQLRLYRARGIPAGPEAVFSDEAGRFAFREGVPPGVYLFDLYSFGFGFEGYQRGLANNAPLKIAGTQDISDIEVIIPGGADARKKSADESDAAVEIEKGVHIKAFIDGSDTIKIQGSKLWYVHHTFDLPGKWGNEGRLTVDDKPTYVNGVKWYAEWIGIETDGKEYSTEWHEKVSQPCQIVGAALPREANDRIRLKKLQGGGLAAITETPKPENSYTLSILLNDDLRGGGAQWYEVVVDWSAPPAPKESAKETARNDDDAATGAKVLPPIPAAKDLPGTLIFQGRYTHRSRGAEYDEPGSVWVTRQDDGAVRALAHLPALKETVLAVGDATHRPVYYAVSREAMGRISAFEARLVFHEDKAVKTRHVDDVHEDDVEFAIEPGALLDINSRPDPYALVNILLRRFALEPGESKEFTMCDWGDGPQGKATFPAYRVRVEHNGKKKVTVPAGDFEANHLVLEQLTSTDSWYRKRAGHLTEFWVLDNGVIVRILRRREPYEVALLDYTVPERLPGHTRVATPVPRKPDGEPGQVETPPIPPESAAIPEDMKACAAKLTKIHQAIEAYRKDHDGQALDWLSDLVPKYIDAQALECPADEPPPESRYFSDPNTPCSYCYELNPQGRSLKESQRRLQFGDVTPRVRCFHHGRVLNLAWDGRLYTSELYWEQVFMPDKDPSQIFEELQEAMRQDRPAAPAAAPPPEPAKGPASEAGPSSDTKASTLNQQMNKYPGQYVIHGRYIHRVGESDYETPSELWVKQNPGGDHRIAVAYLPFEKETTIATSGDVPDRFNYYKVESPGYVIALNFRGNHASLYRRGLREDASGKRLAIPMDALLDPNTRPDSYVAANLLLRDFGLTEGETKEFRVFDWDNTGDVLVDYTIQLKHTGKERVEVPAGTFEANHVVLTQLTAADTWFKKRAGHVTEFWVLDNGVIVRVLRHREPYEMVLLDYTIPDRLPGQLSAPKPRTDRHLGAWRDGDILITMDKDTFRMAGGGRPFAGPYRVDYTKDPAWIDIQMPEAGSIKGVFDFPGENTLRIAVTSGNAPRPVAFQSGQGGGEVLTLQRVKATARDTVPPELAPWIQAAAAEANAAITVVGPLPGADGKVLAFDDFEDVLSLEWEILHEDKTRYSLERKRGTLTITTQLGSVASFQPEYKNLFLIDCPTSPSGDFQMTTCISGFQPNAPFQQAGFVLYNDDDNCMKWVFQFGEQRAFSYLAEVNGARVSHRSLAAPPDMDRFWLSVTKRGNVYNFYMSFDGKSFFRFRPFGDPHGVEMTDQGQPWGDGTVKKIGLSAGTGMNEAPEIDASFEFFEVRAIEDVAEAEKRPDPAAAAPPPKEDKKAEMPEKPAVSGQARNAGEPGEVLAFDDFDDVLSLEWEVLHEDKTHYSLEKKRGALTITAQDGDFARDLVDYENMFLIDSPQPESPDFQLTTCISGFKPSAEYQQAGLIFFNDEDNYLKWVYQPSFQGRVVTVLAEIERSNRPLCHFAVPQNPARLWLRVAKRGNRYRVFYSVDGRSFVHCTTPTFFRGERPFDGEMVWGDGSVKKIGFLSETGSGTGAPEIDASFEFFEVRALAEAAEPEKRPEPVAAADVRTDRHLGVWRARDLVVTMDKDTFRMTGGDRSIAAPYQIDYTKDPVWIDIQMADVGNIRGILDFPGEDTLRIAATAGDAARPVAFRSGQGGGDVLTLQRDKAAVKAVAPPPMEVGEVLAFDDFEDVLSLEWKILHEDKTHYSLEKKRGALTITAQDGEFARADADYENLFLIDSTQPQVPDFQITTCISGFQPNARYQQAGLIFWNDEDNHVKWAYETSGRGRTLTAVTETQQQRESLHHFVVPRNAEKVWLRATKRRSRYRFFFSVDGKSFLPCTAPFASNGAPLVDGDLVWGDGSIRQVGLFAQTGSGTGAPEIDASFEFFEVRALPEDAALAPAPEARAESPAPRQPVAGAGLSITGRVTDVDGKPLAGVKVQGTSSAPDGRDVRSSETVTDADGRFRFDGVPSGSFYYLKAHTEGYAAATINRRLSGQPEGGFDFRLEKAVFFSGRVVDTKGRPVSGVYIRLVPTLWERDPGASAMPLGPGIVSTDKNGRFEARHAAAGRYWVKVRHHEGEGWHQRGLEQPLVLKAGERLEDYEIRILPPEANVISGQVVDGRGNPRSGFFVDTYIPHDVHWSMHTDEQGRFVLKGLNGIGRDPLDVYFGDYNIVIRDVPIGTTDLKYVVHEPGGISGVVLDESGEKPLAGYELTVDRVDLLDCAAVATQPGAGVNYGSEPGVFHLTNVPAGKAVLELKFGACKQWAQVDVRPGEVTKDIRITLQPPCVLEGRMTVTDTRGPARNASLEIVSLDSGKGMGWFRTDENGFYRIDTLPAGAYAVRALYQRQGEWYRTKNVRLEHGKTVTENFQLGGTATIRGIARFPAQDYNGANIQLREKGLGTVPDVWSDRPKPTEHALTVYIARNSGDEYRIQNVPAGTWEVVAFAFTSDRCISFHRRPHTSHVVTIKEGETLELDLDLTVPAE